MQDPYVDLVFGASLYRPKQVQYQYCGRIFLAWQPYHIQCSQNDIGNYSGLRSYIGTSKLSEGAGPAGFLDTEAAMPEHVHNIPTGQRNLLERPCAHGRRSTSCSTAYLGSRKLPHPAFFSCGNAGALQQASSLRHLAARIFGQISSKTPN